MASSLEDDLSCPVCCEVYKDPQLLSCGHSLCRHCLGFDLWFVWTCPICQTSSQQKPVANVVLRNTCESYLKEKEKERENEVRCSLHGEKMSFFCEVDGKVLCSECRKNSHSSHRVQPLTQAVRQRKRQVMMALGPAKKALESLQCGTTEDAKFIRYIKYQAQHSERVIKKDFEKLHQFLREEEEARITSLKEEEERKIGKINERVELQTLSLLDKVNDVEGELENDNVTFLQNFGSVQQRAQYKVPDPELDSGALINVTKHLGNLRYRVWEKMKDVCPHYSVVLDPNTAPANYSISDDLECVEKSTKNHPIPTPLQGNIIVLGSEGFSGDYHCWNVEVGDSKSWTIGVCLGTAARRPVYSLTSGFWGLRCEGNTFKVLNSTRTISWYKMPKIVRVKLGWTFGMKTLCFFDGNNAFIMSDVVPNNEELFPFVVPGEHPSVLHIPHDNVTITVKKKFSLVGRIIEMHKHTIPLLVYYPLLLSAVFFSLMFLLVHFVNQKSAQE